ncbi:MAG: chemotaxis protein CheD [Leptospiraceae bacterium]|nr:chemotaxis protein CheD [Leptospiraceae bacterium]MCP5497578.1 chemotaxis protein CheD [Leptospiraceae bacterium]
MTAPEHLLEIFLQPGDFFWGDESTRIRTILGSCISICMWHPAKKIGGMCHFMLPYRGINSLNSKPNILDGRYAEEAWKLFEIEIQRSKSKATEFHVKLFGGANMFPNIYTLSAKNEKTKRLDMGERNIEATRLIVKKNRLNVVSESLGGNTSRRIHFDLWSGNVWLKRQPYINDIGEVLTQ